MISLFSLFDLRDDLRKPGCPICQIRWKSAWRYLSFLLYESVNDGETRLRFWAGIGYCPDHTDMLAAISRKDNVKPLGMNILYESLASLIKAAISEYPIPKKRKNPLRKVLLRVSRSRFSANSIKALIPISTCRVCQIADESAYTGLETLMECLQDPEEKVYRLYPNSDGICLPHLRVALQEFAEQYPTAASILKDHAKNRLAHWEQAMGEYIRKQAWQNRFEKVTDEEEKALQRALAFFTGDRPSAFILHPYQPAPRG